jgi:hypothetical protein
MPPPGTIVWDHQKRVGVWQSKEINKPKPGIRNALTKELPEKSPPTNVLFICHVRQAARLFHHPLAHSPRQSPA